METIVRKVSESESDKYYKEASGILQKGGLVAFPTETVYGLGGNGLDMDAAKKIYAAKGRPSDNPLIIHIGTKEALNELAASVPEEAWKLADVFWPGPLTMVLPKAENVPYGTTGGLETVAVRMPNHPVALRLIKESGIYIAAPSANTSGRPSPTTAQHVETDLDGRIDMIIDGGAVGIGIESTIVDVTVNPPMILRPGYITKKMLEDVVGNVEVDKAILGKMSPDVKPKAPGMKYKHYAPKAELTMFRGERQAVATHINDISRQAESEGKKVGVIASDETFSMYEWGNVVSIGTRNDDDSIARNLYAVLRKFDDMNVDVIYSETFDDDGLGQAIMNRMLKAAGYNVLQV